MAIKDRLSCFTIFSLSEVPLTLNKYNLAHMGPHAFAKASFVARNRDDAQGSRSLGQAPINSDLLDRRLLLVYVTRSASGVCVFGHRHHLATYDVHDTTDT